MQKTKRLALVRALPSAPFVAAANPGRRFWQPGNPPEVWAKFSAKLNPKIEIVRFARKREAGIKRENTH
ncbi:hypothetical protein [Sporomusa termitida]|uniref:Uncharacterized protein n=1 Tax=Sporomusa termitida TaxID=2377 RepID=A0A517DVU0_9FIRM|nr:hypothetical protein [Sporomusa termitida]QDR81386.1 hypothetical protein SPTER_27660 [Sporomusa termitida]